MEIFQVDEKGRLFISPEIDDWQPLEECGISVVIDLDGGMDIGIPTIPNQLLYIYFPIDDIRALPDLEKMHAVARLGASLVERGYTVLSHCGMGFNRSALMAGVILTYLGVPGEEAAALIRQRRPGALFNKQFACYLQSLSSVPV